MSRRAEFVPIIVIAFIAIGSTVGAAQDSASHILRLPPISETPFLDDIREAAVRLRLTDLRTRARAGPREIRLWSGFGLGGVRLLILRQHRSRWQAYGVDQVDQDSRVRIVQLPDTADWGRLWDTAVEQGLQQLPAYPHRDSSNLMMNDGFGAVMEWFDGERYHVSGADNPDSCRSPDDARFLTVLGVFLPYVRDTPCASRSR